MSSKTKKSELSEVDAMRKELDALLTKKYVKELLVDYKNEFIKCFDKMDARMDAIEDRLEELEDRLK